MEVVEDWGHGVSDWVKDGEGGRGGIIALVTEEQLAAIGTCSIASLNGCGDSAYDTRGEIDSLNVDARFESGGGDRCSTVVAILGGDQVAGEPHLTSRRAGDIHSRFVSKPRNTRSKDSDNGLLTKNFKEGGVGSDKRTSGRHSQFRSVGVKNAVTERITRKACWEDSVC